MYIGVGLVWRKGRYPCSFSVPLAYYAGIEIVVGNDMGVDIEVGISIDQYRRRYRYRYVYRWWFGVVSA